MNFILKILGLEPSEDISEDSEPAAEETVVETAVTNTRPMTDEELMLGKYYLYHYPRDCNYNSKYFNYYNHQRYPALYRNTLKPDELPPDPIWIQKDKTNMWVDFYWKGVVTYRLHLGDNPRVELGQHSKWDATNVFFDRLMQFKVENDERIKEMQAEQLRAMQEYSEKMKKDMDELTELASKSQNKNI